MKYFKMSRMQGNPQFLFGLGRGPKKPTLKTESPRSTQKEDNSMHMASSSWIPFPYITVVWKKTKMIYFKNQKLLTGQEGRQITRVYLLDFQTGGLNSYSILFFRCVVWVDLWVGKLMVLLTLSNTPRK